MTTWCINERGCGWVRLLGEVEASGPNEALDEALIRWPDAADLVAIDMTDRKHGDDHRKARKG